jgi:hypothetical protein
MPPQLDAIALQFLRFSQSSHNANIPKSHSWRTSKKCYNSSSMKVIPDRLVSLGFGKYVRSDKIVALVPIEEERGSGRRTLVYVDTLPEPLVAGRTEGTILRDMVGVESGSVELLRELQVQIGQVRPLLKSSIRSEAGLDLDKLSGRISDLTGEQ